VKDEIDPSSATAYHEAGHAVVRYWAGREAGTAHAFKSASIEEDADSLGRVIHNSPGAWFQPDIATDSRTRKRLETEIMGSLAGFLAVERAGYPNASDGSEKDLSTAAMLAGYVCGSVEETEAYIEWLRLRTVALLGREFVWRGVVALATALESTGTIRWREAKSLIVEPFMTTWNR
jgi:hypothetical protein